MKTMTKILTGGAAVAALAVAAAPAQAQYYGGYYDYDRYETDRTVSDVVAGVAAVAGAVTGAVRGYSPYGGYGYNGYGSNSWGYAPYSYGNYRFVSGEQVAVNACGSEAQRFGGAVRVTDVDRRNRNRFRVHGIVDGGGYGYNRYGYGRDLRFSCTARYDGRVTDFDTRRL
jgi:hypothetical protein